jgi:tetratricopeptide (TPR) repeat protein
MAGRNSDSAGYAGTVSFERPIGINAHELARLTALDTGALPMDGIGHLAPVRSDDRTVLPQYVKRAVAYMRGNLAERITLAELASACGLSQRTLLKQFQRFVGLPPPDVACAAARSYYQRACALDNNDPLVTVARASVASLLSISFERDEADALATRALAMDPTSAWAWERRGFTRVAAGGEPQQAIDDFLRALRLRGPDMPQSNCFLGIADAHRAAGRREEASLWVRKAIAANPQAIWLHRNRSLYAWELGDRTEQMQAVDCLRRGLPELTASRVARSWPCPDWFDALVAAGMPLT